MTDEQKAVFLLLDRIKNEGLQWYFHAALADVDMFERRISGKFSIFEGGELHEIGPRPTGSLPSKTVLLVQPSANENEAILGLWLKWNFAADPFEFRLFVGQWSQIGGTKTFIAFRFEAPEMGEQHDYYHCQPSRDFGDRDPVPHAVLISHRFPTIPVNASNIVELTICALMACMGHKGIKAFVRKLLRDSSAADNAPLKSAYMRCCQ